MRNVSIRNERTETRRRDTANHGTGQRQSSSRDQQTGPIAVLPLLDWPKDLFSRPEVMVASSAD